MSSNILQYIKTIPNKLLVYGWEARQRDFYIAKMLTKYIDERKMTDTSNYLSRERSKLSWFVLKAKSPEMMIVYVTKFG